MFGDVVLGTILVSQDAQTDLSQSASLVSKGAQVSAI